MASATNTDTGDPEDFASQLELIDETNTSKDVEMEVESTPSDTLTDIPENNINSFPIRQSGKVAQPPNTIQKYGITPGPDYDKIDYYAEIPEENDLSNELLPFKKRNRSQLEYPDSENQKVEEMLTGDKEIPEHPDKQRKINYVDGGSEDPDVIFWLHQSGKNQQNYLNDNDSMKDFHGFERENREIDYQKTTKKSLHLVNENSDCTSYYEQNWPKPGQHLHLKPQAQSIKIGSHNERKSDLPSYISSPVRDPVENANEPPQLQNNEYQNRRMDPNHFTIIIEPVGNVDTKKKFLGSELKVSRALQQTIFGKIGIMKINKNVTKNLLIVKTKITSETNLQNMLSVTSIADMDVTCRRPLSDVLKLGVIGPFDKYTKEEEILEEIKENGYNNSKIVRITKGKTPTSFFKVEFQDCGREIPEYLIIGYQRYKVNPYVAEPWQCFNCQGFGHNASSCKSKIRCVVCAGPHRHKECKIKEKAKVK